MNCSDCKCVRKGGTSKYEECVGYNSNLKAYTGCNKLCPQCRGCKYEEYDSYRGTSRSGYNNIYKNKNNIIKWIHYLKN